MPREANSRSPARNRSAESVHCTSALTDACTSPRFSQTPPFTSIGGTPTVIGRHDLRRRKSDAGRVHQAGQAIAVCVERRARAVDHARAVELPACQQVERAPSLAHREDERRTRSCQRGVGERHQMDVESAAAKRTGDLLEAAASRSSGGAPANIPLPDTAQSVASRANLPQKLFRRPDVRRADRRRLPRRPAPHRDGSRAPGAVPETPAGRSHHRGWPVRLTKNRRADGVVSRGRPDSGATPAAAVPFA